MTTPRQPTPAAPEHVAKYVASPADFTCPGCGDTFRQGAVSATEFDAWTCECTPKPDLTEWRSPAGVGFAAVMLAVPVLWIVLVVLVGRAL